MSFKFIKCAPEALDDLIRDGILAGRTYNDVALELGVSGPTVRRRAHRQGIASQYWQRRANDERNTGVLAARADGKTFAQIGEEFGIAAARAHQIVAAAPIKAENDIARERSNAIMIEREQERAAAVQANKKAADLRRAEKINRGHRRGKRLKRQKDERERRAGIKLKLHPWRQ